MNAPLEGAARLLQGLRSPRADPLQAGEPRPVRLVLFVGRTPPLEPGFSALLAQAGLRGAWVADTEQAAQAATQMHFDALVLDAAVLAPSLPVALAALRDRFAAPLLVLTDQPDEIDEIVALEHGAAAYLARPAAPRRLRAHLVAALRFDAAGGTGRAAAPPAARPRIAGWALESQSRELRGHGRAMPLTECQFALLRALAAPPGRLVSRGELLEQVMPFGAGFGARSIDVYVHRLRRRLAEHRVDGLQIEAVRGRGYRLNVGQIVGDLAGPAAAPYLNS